MKNGNRIQNQLIVIEKQEFTAYNLDDKAVWEVGRASSEHMPDIVLNSPTVSRKHGKFRKVGGEWYYVDYFGKNGTVFNKKHISPGKPKKLIYLNQGDTFVFGGGKEEVIGPQTIWALFLENGFKEEWLTIDSAGWTQISFAYDDDKLTLEKPQKGETVIGTNGIAIYMGDLTYVVGDMEVRGK